MGGPPQRGGSRSNKKLLPNLAHFSFASGQGEASCAFGTRPGGIGIYTSTTVKQPKNERMSHYSLRSPGSSCVIVCC